MNPLPRLRASDREPMPVLPLPYLPTEPHRPLSEPATDWGDLL